MHRSQKVLSYQIVAVSVFAGFSLQAAVFSGEGALAFTRQAVANGPRPSGSAAIHHLQTEIIGVLNHSGCQVTFDDFEAGTPAGTLKMRNILCRFPGKSGRAIAITGHYDTKRLPQFVGANDGGSSTGFLMELAGALKNAPRADDVIVVFLDGEEAVQQWTETDSLYGSRHLAEVWQKNGTLSKLKALINVDMIGDKDLNLVYDADSESTLRELVWSFAEHLGYGSHFPRKLSAMEDDHIPFVKNGVRALDLIDFSYGPNNSYWHTPEDTIDKLSAKSLEVIGTVVLDVIRQLESTP